MNAVGLELSDLFPPDTAMSQRRGERRPRVDLNALLFVIRHDVTVLGIAAGKMQKGETFTKDDWATLDRVTKSLQRLDHVRQR